MAPPRARLRRWLVFAGVAGVAALLVGVRAWLGPTVPAVAAARAPLVERVVASGRVLPPARIQIGSVVVARVVRVPFDEGDRVKPGDVLVQLDDAEARAALAQAQAQVAQAAARLEQVQQVSGRVNEESVRQSELRLARAELRLARTRTLADAGSLSQSDLDDSLEARDLAASQLDAARVQAAASTAGADRRAAVAALEQARAAERAAAARLDQLQVRAPAPGVVTERHVEPGDVVQPGRALLVVVRDGATQLSVQPDEKNLALLRLGQEAAASADAFPDRLFPARVAYIAPAVDLSRGTVEVKLDVADPPPFLRPDMTVSVNVEVRRDGDALVVPAGSVRDAGGEPWVLVVRGGRTERQPVKLGMRGDGAVQVLSGLAPGEAVVSPSAPVGPGRRVRVELARPAR